MGGHESVTGSGNSCDKHLWWFSGQYPVLAGMSSRATAIGDQDLRCAVFDQTARRVGGRLERVVAQQTCFFEVHVNGGVRHGEDRQQAFGLAGRSRGHAKLGSGEKRAGESEVVSKEAKRVKTTLDDDEIQDMPEWDIFEEYREEQQPPTEEEERSIEADANGNRSTAGARTEETSQTDAPVEERRAVRVGGVISSNEEAGEQKRRRIMKQRKEDLSKSSGGGQASKRWEAIRAKIRGKHG